MEKIGEHGKRWADQNVSQSRQGGQKNALHV